MSENYLKKFLKQLSIYFSKDVIVTLASFITFPILTRVFTEAEYGQMSLAEATFGMIIVFSKFGIQRSALRFYSEFKENKRNLDITYYYTTSFLSGVFISIIIASIFLVGIEIYPKTQLSSQYIKILRLLSLMVIIDGPSSILFTFLRAEQKVKFYSIIGVVQKYLTVLSTLFFLLVLKRGLFGFFVGRALVEGLICAIISFIFFKQGKIKFWHISFALFKDSLSYGFPLLGLELTALFLDSGDRFLLQHFLGAAAVGIYSASYNVTKYCVGFFAGAFRVAVMPLFMSIWEKKGREETQNFLSVVLNMYFMIGIPLIFVVSFLGRDLMVLLASKKYEEGYVIIPFVVIGYVIYNANFIYAAGLYLSKKTTKLLIINAISTVFNIIFNLLLIPRLGLYAAAITTLGTFILEVVLLVIVSYRTVSYKLPIYSFMKYVAISIVMVIVMLNIQNLGPAQTFLRIIVGFLIYGSGILLFEAQVRSKARLLLQRILAR